MPDWTYQTVFKPILTHLPYSAAQKLVFRTMGTLASSPPGRMLIRLMGHALPDRTMLVRRGEQRFTASTALASGVDSENRGTGALALFGFGLIEVGPFGPVPSHALTEWTDSGAVEIKRGILSADTNAIQRLKRLQIPEDVQIIARLAIPMEANRDAALEVAESLAECVSGFAIDVNDVDLIHKLSKLQPVYLRVAAKHDSLDVPENSWAGVIVDQAGQSLDELADSIGKWRSRIGEESVIIADTALGEPIDAIELRNSGADLVMIGTGFAEAGPGLPKRINRLLTTSGPEVEVPPLFSPEKSFFWSMVTGIALFAGGLVAMLLGSTRVLLPYDEEYLGMLREELCGFNEQILPFMSHDRVTLAGTMLSLGTLYVTAALNGDRFGRRWARTAFLASAFVGFLSFFLFFGFGYFDPFHAFIAAILFQFILLGLRSPLSPTQVATADLRNSTAWRRAMWGQLIFVAHGFAILVAGIVISSFGVTTVFVAQDLDFMQTTAEEIRRINPRLVPLVAHDRASFGGMLMSTGVFVVLAAMWGWQRGQKWLWMSLGAAGSMAYGCTLVIHWTVGYTSLGHLLPAYGGLMALGIALALSREWMFAVETAADDYSR